MDKSRKSNIPIVTERVREAFQKYLDRIYSKTPNRDEFHNSLMEMVVGENEELEKLRKWSFEEFRNNNPELGPDYLEGFNEGSYVAFLITYELLRRQIEEDDLRDSFKEIDKWKIS